jgi:hypothetical protein
MYLLHRAFQIVFERDFHGCMFKVFSVGSGTLVSSGFCFDTRHYQQSLYTSLQRKSVVSLRIPSSGGRTWLQTESHFPICTRIMEHDSINLPRLYLGRNFIVRQDIPIRRLSLA